MSETHNILIYYIVDTYVSSLWKSICTHIQKMKKKEEKTREKERKCYEGGVDTSGADPEIFQRGLRRKILKNVC